MRPLPPLPSVRRPEVDLDLCSRGSGLPWRTCPCGDCGFTRHLSHPCDHAGCTDTATHNGTDQETGECREFCNAHTSWDHPAFARND